MTGYCDSNLSNWSCNDNNYCEGPEDGSNCKPCSILTEGNLCKCAPYIDSINCQNCVNSVCTACIEFFILNSNSDCVNNFCSGFISQCADGKRCLSTTVDRSTCVDCVIGQSENCKCAQKTNCETCDATGTNCATCLEGFELKSGNCVIKTNICNEYGQNDLCDNNFFCNGNFPQLCTSCTNLAQNQYCKCPNQDLQNCTSCNDSGCISCVSKYAVEFSRCKLNTCGMSQNTLNCAFNHYCPANSPQNAECVPCDGKSTHTCNCGTIKTCKTCGIDLNTCGSCFLGYYLSAGTCLRTPNTCEPKNVSTNCSPGHFCNGPFGTPCEPCTSLPLNKSCQCSGISVQNCTKCDSDRCQACLSGLYPLNNICMQNTCVAGQSSQACVVNNYCPVSPVGKNVSCSLCDKNSPIACNCKTAQNCATCIESGEVCQDCLNGFVLEDGICVQQRNICDSVQSSNYCDSGNFCDGIQGEQCVSCQGIKISYFCYCGGNLQQNCLICEKTLCKTCLAGFLPVLGVCRPNNCDNQLTNKMCQDGFICSSSKPGDDCSSCISGQKTACKCGTAENCTLCGVTSNTCSECIEGTKLNQILQCQSISTSENICDGEKMSIQCNSGAFCAGNPGDNCVPCNFITTGKNCNCNDELLENCQFCDGKKCKFCISGFAVMGGICVPNLCGINGKDCLNGFYCPGATSGAQFESDTLCRECSSYTIEECTCGTAKNCQTCSLTPNTCQTCLEGNFLQGGKCSPPTICSGGQICPVGQFCQSNGTCAECSKQQIACSCDLAVNCQKCGIPGACINCLDGWQQDVNGSCSVPVCANQPAMNQYCAGPNKNKQCPNNQILIDSMVHQCNCGEKIDGCANCKVNGIGCKDCMQDYTMMLGICIFTPPGYTGSCDEQNGASLCIEGMGCKNYGQCVICSELGVGQECKCDGDVIQVNCVECDGDKCKKCNKNSILIDGECREHCDQSSQCSDFKMCDVDVSACVPCNGILPCKCGESVNCMYCNEKAQCNGCLKGYVLDNNGSCDICDKGFQMIQENPTVCGIQHDDNLGMSWLDIVGCCVAAVIIIVSVVLMMRKCISRPKKYAFQHNLMN